MILLNLLIALAIHCITNSGIAVPTDVLLQLHVLYQNAAATRTCDAATTMLLPQHTAAEAGLGDMS